MTITAPQPEVIRVSYSSLSTLASCARKFELDKLYPRLEKPADEFYAADVGKALHAGYQSWLVNQDEEQAIWEFTRVFPFELEYQQTNDYRSYNAALSTLEEMFANRMIHEYRLAEIINPKGETVPAIEVPFAIRFSGLSIPPCERFPHGAVFEFIGFVDAIMQHVMTDAFMSVDIKTTRMQVTSIDAKCKFDTQQVPYGIVIDHIARGAVDSFNVLYINAYIDLLKPIVDFATFRKTQADIQEWAFNRVLEFQQLAKYAALDYFPRTEHGCLFYNKPCRFLEPCQSRERKAIMDWLTLGNKEFVVDTFEPWITTTLEVAA
jgi:hypothetical protein